MAWKFFALLLFIYLKFSQARLNPITTRVNAFGLSSESSNGILPRNKIVSVTIPSIKKEVNFNRFSLDRQSRKPQPRSLPIICLATKFNAVGLSSESNHSILPQNKIVSVTIPSIKNELSIEQFDRDRLSRMLQPRSLPIICFAAVYWFKFRSNNLIDIITNQPQWMQWFLWLVPCLGSPSVGPRLTGWLYLIPWAFWGWLKALTDKTRNASYSVHFNGQNLQVSRDARLEEIHAYINRAMGKRHITFFNGNILVETRMFVSNLVNSDLEVDIDGNRYQVNLTMFRSLKAHESTSENDRAAFVKPMTAFKVAEKTLYEMATSILRCVQERDKFIYHLRIDNNDIVLSSRATVKDLTTSLNEILGVVEEPVSFFDVGESQVGIRILVDGERVWSGERLSDMFWSSLVIEIGNREVVATQRCFLPNRTVEFKPMTTPIEIKSIFGGVTLSMLHVRDITVKELKQRIYRDARIPPEVQLLVYKGLQLQDHLTLSSYDINPYDVIYMIRRLRGGGRHTSICSEEACGCTSHIAFVGCCAVCRRLCKCKECQNPAPVYLQKESDKVGQYYRKIDSETSQLTDADKEEALFR
jgi:hypothetical protein